MVGPDVEGQSVGGQKKKKKRKKLAGGGNTAGRREWGSQNANWGKWRGLERQTSARCHVLSLSCETVDDTKRQKSMTARQRSTALC